jgi:hypothetical protein
MSTGIDFSPYIYKVLLQVHPNKIVTIPALKQISEVLVVLLYSLLKSFKVNKSLKDSVPKVIYKQLLKHSIVEANKAVNKYESGGDTNGFNFFASNRKNISKPKTRTTISGLQFSVLYVENVIKFITSGTFKFDSEFVIYLTAILEYITAEILELGGNESRRDDIYVIKIKHLLNAINNDDELKAMFNRIGVEFNPDSENINMKYSFSELTIGKVGTVNEYDEDPLDEDLLNNDNNELNESIPEFEQDYKEFADSLTIPISNLITEKEDFVYRVNLTEEDKFFSNLCK